MESCIEAQTAQQYSQSTESAPASTQPIALWFGFELVPMYKFHRTSGVFHLGINTVV